jgi:formylglycine-generating enzyme required for sulfatase activity
LPARPSARRRSCGFVALVLLVVVGAFATPALWPNWRSWLPFGGIAKDLDHPIQRNGDRRPGDVATNALGMKFAWCPPGTFTMGSPENELGRIDEEVEHTVTLTKGFYLAVYLVTQEQWRAVMDSNPSHFKGDDLPVDSVTWLECQDFCAKLGQRDGKRYRLPTEAEWEYACRAGTKTAYSSGDDIEAMKRAGWCSYDGESGSAMTTKAVGQFEANAWGLYDMHGNVYQFCQDRFGSYPNEAVTDPLNDKTGMTDKAGDPLYLLRGGSWYTTPPSCRSAARWHGYRGEPRYANYGCRVVLEAD